LPTTGLISLRQPTTGMFPENVRLKVRRHYLPLHSDKLSRGGVGMHYSQGIRPLIDGAMNSQF